VECIKALTFFPSFTNLLYFFTALLDVRISNSILISLVLALNLSDISTAPKNPFPIIITSSG